MARKYSAFGSDSNTVSTTIMSINATTTARPVVYDVIVGAEGTPADNAATYALRRFTTSNGTGTAVTPNALDPGNPAAVTAVSAIHTAEPTYTAGANTLKFSLNMRATFRWVAAPGGEIILPATAQAGVGLLADQVSSAFSATAMIHFEE